MSQQVDGNTKSFTAGAALAQWRLVRLSSGKLAYNGAANADPLGVLTRATFADLDIGTVKLITSAGTMKITASEAISQGAAVYAAASGKIASTGDNQIGYALEASGADGDVIEILPSRAGAIGTLDRASLTQDDLAVYNVPLTSLRVHDALQTNLPGTAADDDLALIGGTYGTAAPTLNGVDFGGTTTTAYARFQFALPPEYVAGQTVTLRVRAAMLTTVADTITVDVEAYETDGDGAVGSDLCATAAASINSLTPANKDFTITPTGLAAGDMLDIRITVDGEDAGNEGVMIPEISAIQLLLDIKG